ncbi:DUF2827 domain-containing protein, partial [Priestia megaterium]|nr:DUF2827 domain-containing protein [Priestia megaterium]
LDVVIEMGAQLPVEWLRHMKALGKKIAAFFCGHVYAGLCETPMFGKPSGHVFNGAPFDEVWLLPQYDKTAAPMLQTILRAPVHLMPHIWSPYFLERRVAVIAGEGATFGYQPGARPWRLAMLEPNISVAKSCHYPMLACDAF